MRGRLMVVMSFVIVDGNGAAVFGDRATDVLELDGGVRDMKTIGEHGVESLENGIADGEGNVLDEDMATECVSAGAEAPDVQVVDVQNPFDGAHPGDHLGEADAPRQAFQQDIQRLANNVPSTPDDQQSDQDREDRVDLGPPRVAYDQ